MKLRTCMLLLALATLWTAPASSTPTTYYWHQTGASLPGLSFWGSYSLLDPAITVAADSNQSAPDLSNLLGFYVQGGQMAPVRRSDLVPTCWPPVPGCIIGLPSWNLTITGSSPSLRFLDKRATYDYTIGPVSIAANTDQGGPCYWTGACLVSGYWSTDVAIVPNPVPLPATLSMLLGGLLALFGFVRAGRGRIRS